MCEADLAIRHAQLTRIYFAGEGNHQNRFEGPSRPSANGLESVLPSARSSMKVRHSLVSIRRMKKLVRQDSFE